MTYLRSVKHRLSLNGDTSLVDYISTIHLSSKEQNIPLSSCIRRNVSLGSVLLLFNLHLGWKEPGCLGTKSTYTTDFPGFWKGWMTIRLP